VNLFSTFFKSTKNTAETSALYVVLVVVVKGGCKEVVGRREAVERVGDVGGEKRRRDDRYKDSHFFYVEKMGRDVT